MEIDRQLKPQVVVTALLSGLLFGFGLTVSEMINPRRVLGFLDVTGAWDPTLGFVMGGALLVSIPAFLLARRLQTPVCAPAFEIPSKRSIDNRLVFGAAMFGVGWGLVGFCPGPAIAALVTGQLDVLLFFGSMLLGMFGFRRWESAKAA